MVRYADDFVVMCRNLEDATAALALVKEWTASAGSGWLPRAASRYGAACAYLGRLEPILGGWRRCGESGKKHDHPGFNPVTVVLNKTNLNGRTWYVLSAFPDVVRDSGLMPLE